ncbi:MAG: aldose 1-epimerase family protein [Eubacteriales bacterium]|nr:aldose 1-epimerase family protein [Eubacteriales bacterium]
MINIFNSNYEASELKKMIGNVSQIGGTRHYELTEGNSRGTRAIDVNTGSGFCFTILPDRGMDISQASYKGINLVFRTQNGEVNPAFYDPKGSEWLRVFFAGLLTTCGLTYFGAPGMDEGADLGLHGRYSAIPARQVCDNSGFSDGEYLIDVSGVIDETVLFGSKLRMKRKIRSKVGSRSLFISDEIENLSSLPSPYTIMYHINFGFPLLDEDSEILSLSSKVEPYDEIAQAGLPRWNKFEKPDSAWREQNFLHTMRKDEHGYTYAAIINQKLMDGLGVYIKFMPDQLPYLSQWKMAGESDYVTALEPCNTMIANRGQLRKEGMLPMIGSYEKKINCVEIGILEGEKEISEFKLMLNQFR